MGNRAAQEAHAIASSLAVTKQGRQVWSRPRKGWRYYPHEVELVDYYNGAHVAAAGLHSSLGQQLERMRDGLGSSYGNPCDIPPELHGAVKRTLLVKVALERVGMLEDVLRGQYEAEPEGRHEGFGCLMGGVDWKKRGLPDLGFKVARGEISDEGQLTEPERLKPGVVVVSITSDMAAGRTVTGLSVHFDVEGVAGVRVALRVLCLSAAGLAPPGEPAPKRAAVDAARDALGPIGTRAKVLLRRAQAAYAKARAGADASEVQRFLAEVDGAE